MKTLATLKKGEIAVIAQIINETLSVRLLELGLFPGKSVKLLRKAPFGDPFYLKVANHYVSIRTEEARQVILCQ